MIAIIGKNEHRGIDHYSRTGLGQKCVALLGTKLFSATRELAGRRLTDYGIGPRPDAASALRVAGRIRAIL